MVALSADSFRAPCLSWTMSNPIFPEGIQEKLLSFKKIEFAAAVEMTSSQHWSAV